MAQEQEPVQGNDRKKRVQRLKKMIVVSLFIGILVPWLLCSVLFLLIGRLNSDLKELQTRSQRLEQLAAEQAAMLQELEESMNRLLEEKKQESIVEKEPEEEVSSVQSHSVETQEPLHKVYLTFDDGPSSYTNDILDILKIYDVKATFFVLGKESEADQEALKRIVAEGHSLGMHSYSHKYEDIYSSKEAFAEDFQKLQDYLFRVTGVTSKLYRFPGGSSNTIIDMDIHDLIDYLDEQDTVYFDWNVSSGDAAKVLLSADTIVRNCTENLTQRKTSVILMHDAAGRPTTVEALPKIIETIRTMDDTVLLPITEETDWVQHVKAREKQDD